MLLLYFFFHFKSEENKVLIILKEWRIIETNENIKNSSFLLISKKLLRINNSDFGQIFLVPNFLQAD